MIAPLARKSRSALVALALLTVPACTVGPNYRPPAPLGGVPLPAFAAAGAQTQPVPPPDDWWTLYRDPALERMVRTAFAANTDLRVAAANLEASRAALDLARAARTPSTGLTAGAQYGVSSPALTAADLGRRTPEPDAILTTGASAAWELDLFGRIRRQVEAARADRDASEALRDAVRVEVAAEVARAYADACAYGAAAEVQRRSIAAAARRAALTRDLAQAGAAGEFEATRSEALVAQSRAGLSPFEAQRRTALYRLAVLMGRPPEETDSDAAHCVEAPILSAAIPVGDGAALIRRRPDVRAAERRLAAATARIGVATADLYPTVDLAAAFATLAPSVAGLGAAASRTWAAGPLAAWAFPNQSAARARIHAARAIADADLAAFDRAVLVALQDVETALTMLAADLDRRTALTAARTRDARASALAEDRFRAGATSFLDLLDAQRTLIADDNALALSAQAVAGDQVQLFKALGGGWRQVEPASSPMS